MGLLLAAIALVATFLQPGAVASPRQLAGATKQPETLYTRPNGEIDAFAQDGPVLVWFAPSATGCNTVGLLSLVNTGEVFLPDESATARNVTCQWDVVPPVRIAVAGSNVLRSEERRVGKSV
jgi:hypothetical protein